MTIRIENLPPGVQRFLRDSHATAGRRDFDEFIVKLRDKAVRDAVFSGSLDTRPVLAGRAQILIELVELFTSA